jgi:excisionase family DNA binding protein
MPSSEEALMDIKQVAAYLQINEATAYNWAQSGKLPGIKIGRIWRFRREDIEAWLDKNMRGRKPGERLNASVNSGE